MDFAFDALPSELKETILAATVGAPPERTLAARLENPGTAVRRAVAAALVALGILALLVLSPLELPLPPGPMPAIALVAAALLGFAAFQLGPVLATRRSRLKPLVLATRDFAVVVRRDGEAVTVRPVRELRNAVVASSWIELRFPDETLVLPLADLARASEVTHRLRDSKDRVPGEPSLREEELARVFAERGSAGAVGRGRRPGLGLVAACALAGPVLVVIAWAVGVRSVERAAYARAVAAGGNADSSAFHFFAGRTRLALGSWQWLVPIREHEESVQDLEEEYLHDHDRSAAGLKAYLRRFPKGRYALEVRPLEDDTAFREALAKPGTDALGTYTQDHPHGRHLDEADDAFFERARTSPAGLDRYRQLFSRGRHVTEIAATRSALSEEAALRLSSGTAPAQRIAALLRFEAKDQDSVLRIHAREVSPTPALEVLKAAAQGSPGIARPGTELAPGNLHKREATLRDQLAKGLTQAFAPGLLRATRADGAPSADASALVLDVRYHVVSTGDEFRIQKKVTSFTGGAPQSIVSYERYAPISLVAEVELRIPGVPTVPVTLEARPPEGFTLLSGFRPGVETVYDQLLEASFESLGEKILALHELTPAAKAGQ